MNPISVNDPLAVFVSKVGGLNPLYAKGAWQGEIRKMREEGRGLPPGAINSKAPLTLEELAERCQEAGYIWEPDVNAFLEALEQDVAACSNNTPQKRVYTWESDRRYQYSYNRLNDEAESESQDMALQAQVVNGQTIIVPTNGKAPVESDAALLAELAAVREENARLKAQAKRKTSMKVSEKGGMSVYGLGRFPLTLYKEQWLVLLDMADDIYSFLVAHDGELKNKGK